MKITTPALPMIALLALSGCYSGFEPPLGAPELGEDEADSGDDAKSTGNDATAGDSGDDGNDSGEPGHDKDDDVDMFEGRRIRRMTASQFHRSLETVTGQSWPLYDDYAGVLGAADFVETTQESREISVTFDKFVHDAALHTCSEAITADIAGEGEGTLLRLLDVSDRNPGDIRRNLDYLMLRFLGQETNEEDPRVAPWMNLLTAHLDTVDDALMAERWTAVCVGLATHPDFFTY